MHNCLYLPRHVSEYERNVDQGINKIIDEIKFFQEFKSIALYQWLCSDISHFILRGWGLGEGVQGTPNCDIILHYPRKISLQQYIFWSLNHICNICIFKQDYNNSMIMS